ncbi:PrsW family intramembrane metalloprotease [Thalassiella azotivora]
MLVGLALGVCGVLTLGAIAYETGASGLVVGLVLAALPVAPVVAAFLWLDRHEAEPPSLLLFAFGWGAAVATLVSLVLNTASTAVLQQSGGDPDLVLFTVAPLVEESTKGLAVLAVLLLRRREFDGVVDGIVYAGMAGIGFAFVENILYFGRSFVEDGGGGVAAVFVLRGVFSPFAHPLFTLAIGIGVGVAVTRRGWAARLLAPFAGWLVAVALHAAWNGSTLLGMQGFLGAYVLLQFPVFVGAITIAVMSRRREARLIREHLGAYAATGWLSAGEVEMLSSLPHRRGARRWAGSSGGADARAAMRDFQELASEVAFLRERMRHGTAPSDASEVEHRMLVSMHHLRPRFVPRQRSTVPVDVPGWPAAAPAGPAVGAAPGHSGDGGTR